MRFAIARPLLALAILLAFGVATAAAQQGNVPAAAPPPAPPVLKLTAVGFSDGGPIAKKYSCQGTSASPQLQWSNVPKGTASFVVVMHGTDNHPAKGMVDEMFWVLWNVPADVTQLPEGLAATPQLPDGSMQAKGGREVIGYRAPCPPPGSGPHHYIFELYAVDQKLDLTPQANRADVMKAIDGHIIGASAFVGVFQQ
jgi:Raf kinase inhibitor-like YbhB/YbcL family protein